MRLRPEQRTLVQLCAVIDVMGGLAWASVPLYSLFCRVTGFGGTTSVASAGPDSVLDRTVTVRFDASKDRDMPWEFKPVQRTMTLRVGETGLAFYEAYNPTDRVVAGAASYNVFPYEAGGFFTKIHCFCFEQQVLQPGERVQMPVTFFVDPAMVDDAEGRYVRHITLSYTFHEIPVDDVEQAALAVDGAADPL